MHTAAVKANMDLRCIYRGRLLLTSQVWEVLNPNENPVLIKYQADLAYPSRYRPSRASLRRSELDTKKTDNLALNLDRAILTRTSVSWTKQLHPHHMFTIHRSQ